MKSSKQNNVINDIQVTRKPFNEIRSNLSREEMNRIREKLYKKEAIYNFLKEKEQEGNLTNNEKKALINIGRHPKNITKHLENLKKHFKKSQKYQYDLDYLFNEHNEEGYTSNNVINAIVVVRNTLNELRNNLSHEETRRIRKKIRRIEAVYNVLKDKEKKGSLISRQRNMLWNDERYLKSIRKHLKNVKKNFEKTQYNIEYLFNERVTSNDDINEFKNARKLLNEQGNNLLHEQTKRIRKKLHNKEAIYNVLSDKEQKGSLTNDEKKKLKKINRYLKNFKKYLEKLEKYWHNITYGLDYLFDELDEEDYYKPTEVKRAFDGSYRLYESKGDNDSKLSINEYVDIIKPYLGDMINNQKTKGEWKIQLSMRVIFASFTDVSETREIYTKSYNILIMNGIETEDIINELINTFNKRYQEGLETDERKQFYIWSCWLIRVSS